MFTKKELSIILEALSHKSQQENFDKKVVNELITKIEFLEKSYTQAFEIFRASGKDVTDISKYGDMWEDHVGMPGRAYLADEQHGSVLIIQKFDTSWYLIIENTQEEGELLDLELSLFDWAISTGWVEL